MLVPLVIYMVSWAQHSTAIRRQTSETSK